MKPHSVSALRAKLVYKKARIDIYPFCAYQAPLAWARDGAPLLNTKRTDPVKTT